MTAVSPRKTVVVLSDYISFVTEGYEGRLRQAFHALCRQRDLNLMLVYGRPLNAPHPSGAAHNFIYDLVDASHTDGIVILSSLLSAACGEERFVEFAQRYAPLPSCSVGVAIPGMPSIQIDNSPGMQAVVEHLISDHGLRRLAFIAGHAGHREAEARLAAYREVLGRHAIVYDPMLVAHGHFVKHGGSLAMEDLLSRGVAMDGVVCANDAMAAGAMEALRKRGRRVPGDLAVTGFDDLVYARLGNPPLTTVAQPFYAMAELGLELVLDQLAGREVPLSTLVATKLIVRGSCGCVAESYRARPGAAITAPAANALEYLRSHPTDLSNRLTACLGVGHADGARDAEQLLKGLERELTGEPNSVLGVIEDLLDAMGSDGERHRSLHDAVTLLREELQAFAPALDPLWHEADRRILLAVTAALFKQRIDLDYNYMQLVGVGERVSVSFELESLESALEQYLPRTGVSSAFLSRFTDGSKNELEPFVRVIDGRLHDSPAVRFPARQLLPGDAYPQDRARTSVVFPLVFKTQCLGVAVFAYAEGIIGYHMLCDQASAALQSVLLHREVVQKTLLHERSIQERLAATERMQALRVLAGGVAHDLNNALGPLLALPDIMLQQLSELAVAPGVVRELRADVDSIKSATLRAAQTVKDLLTLSRQGRTPKSPVDLNQVILSCLGADAVRFMADAKSEIQVVLELARHELMVIASEAHLMRAITNLVHNAVDAISGQGEVVVRTFSTRVIESRSGYELVAPGEYAVVTVSDNGGGLPAGAIDRLFEPFFSTKPVKDHSGSGLGLAIVHGVVKEHEGFIDVVSAVDQGTTFSLYFPLSDEPALINDPVPALRHERAKILIVDDDPTQLRTSRRVLMHYGYEVETFTTGQQALRSFELAARASGDPYDLLILDLHIGGADDGLEILEQIRGRFPRQKAILVSGEAANQRIEGAIAEGIPWLAKPFTADALANAVRGALAGQPSISVLRVSSRPP